MMIESKSWEDYLEECLPSAGERHDIRVGMRMAFNFIKAEFPPAEACKAAADLLKAVEANVQWHDVESGYLGTFHDRMDLCCYSEWASRKALGQDVGEFKGVPQLIITRKEQP
jgi:hypothetical protein